MATHRVLVVEDDPAILGYCQTVLESAGFDVVACETCADARKLYDERRPDLAVLDIGLPDGNGLELLKEWKGLPGAHPPVLFLTGRGDLKTRLDCFQSGGQDYVHKPFAAEELLARVKVHLHLKKSHDELIRKNYELELIARARQDMTDMIVHDLKAPLTSIKGTLDLVLAHGLISQKHYSTLLEHAGSAADFMLLMLNDLLDVGQARTAGLRSEAVPLDTPMLFDKLKTLFAGRSRSLKVELQFVCAPDCARIMADQNLLYRVLANLITNAMKFSQPGQAVEIDCIHAGKSVRFMVLDRGPGVAAPEREKIFQKYETTGRKAADGDTGTGIGLAFCAAAAQAMKGKIWVEDRPGGGSRFVLEFPFEPA